MQAFWEARFAMTRNRDSGVSDRLLHRADYRPASAAATMLAAN